MQALITPHLHIYSVLLFVGLRGPARQPSDAGSNYPTPPRPETCPVWQHAATLWVSQQVTIILPNTTRYSLILPNTPWYSMILTDSTIVSLILCYYLILWNTTECDTLLLFFCNFPVWYQCIKLSFSTFSVFLLSVLLSLSFLFI